MILTDADELRKALRLALEERDEARAEVERLERLFQQTHGVHHTWVDARHKVAERQRTACAEAVGGLRVIFGDEWNGAIKRAKAVVRATPLVTDTKADGGSP